jgi:hypothetical protein
MMTDLEPKYPHLARPYIHLAMAHGAGPAHSTIIGKTMTFKDKLTCFAAVPEMLKRYYANGDDVSTSRFLKKTIKPWWTPSGFRVNVAEKEILPAVVKNSAIWCENNEVAQPIFSMNNFFFGFIYFA